MPLPAITREIAKTTQALEDLDKRYTVEINRLNARLNALQNLNTDINPGVLDILQRLERLGIDLSR